VSGSSLLQSVSDISMEDGDLCIRVALNCETRRQAVSPNLFVPLNIVYFYLQSGTEDVVIA